MCRITAVTYDPAPDSVPRARHWLRNRLDVWDLTMLEPDASLLVTELVTNAVVHAESLWGSESQRSATTRQDRVRLCHAVGNAWDSSEVTLGSRCLRSQRCRRLHRGHCDPTLVRGFCGRSSASPELTASTLWIAPAWVASAVGRYPFKARMAPGAGFVVDVLTVSRRPASLHNGA